MPDSRIHNGLNGLKRKNREHIAGRENKVECVIYNCSQNCLWGNPAGLETWLKACLIHINDVPVLNGHDLDPSLVNAMEVRRHYSWLVHILWRAKILDKVASLSNSVDGLSSKIQKLKVHEVAVNVIICQVKAKRSGDLAESDVDGGIPEDSLL